MIRKVIFCALCAMALVACKKETYQGNVQLKPVSITGDVIALSSNSATLSGTTNKGAIVTYIEHGILLSTEPEPTKGNSREQYASTDNLTFYIIFSGLTPSTTYYYRSFLYYDGLSTIHRTYGEVKSFTTPAS